MQTRTSNVTVDATVEVQKYLGEPNIKRLENPLAERQKQVYLNLYKLAVAFVYSCFICGL